MSDSTLPERCCDLVMKGGITSGILYPPAVSRIAEKFFLVGIGGTSAGAIASCLAAAAEYRRRQDGTMVGFERLQEIPWELADEGRLLSLFRPDARTRKLHKLFLKAQGLGDAGWWRRTWWKSRLLWRIYRHKRTLKPVIANGFGLCTGMAVGNRPDGLKTPPLTEWLADAIDEIAGLNGRPLTFGDLRQAPLPPHLANTMVGTEESSIDLRVVTTCVTFGRPYLLPFRDNIFAFDPQEWRRLFPRRIVDDLVAKAEVIETKSRRQDGKQPLPAGDDLPVIVAARMSLSFPGLFTMVPLYAVDYNASPPPAGQSRPLRKVWFSDGGITSNLPIHFFDVLYPRWPTLALNLQYTDRAGQPARSAVDKSLVYMIKRRSDGTRDLWHTFGESGAGIPDLLTFLQAIFRSAQVWHDHSLLRLPGYRDRVVEIWLRPEEGGLNLDMPRAIIKTLIDRGNDAGSKLRDRFAETPNDHPLSWDGHRWTRLRASLEGLALALQGFERSVHHPLPGDRTLEDLMALQDAVPCHPFDSMVKLEEARRAIDNLLLWIGELTPQDDGSATNRHPFADGPRPPLEVRGIAPM